jgi:diacylglycerol O-acyltransferase / wax synthase
MEQLGGLGATFVYCETPAMHLHVCGLFVLDTTTMPGGYSFERVRSTLLERLAGIPAFRHKLAHAPLHLGRPLWVDDTHLDIEHHIQRVTLAPPRDDRVLATLVGDIASCPLRRDRPLWELWVVEGLPHARIALVMKVHNSTIDGVSGAHLISRLFDPERVGTFSPANDRLRSGGPPSQLALLGRGLASRLAEPCDVVRLVPQTAWRLSRTLWQLGRPGADRRVIAVPFTAPRTEFNYTITARRSVAFADVALADVKRVKDAAGVTVNDVVTGIVAGALRRYLDDRGALPERPLIAAQPVAVHDKAPDHDGAINVSVMFSTLATDEKDPLDRLRAVAAANAEAKEIHRMVGAGTLVRWADHFWLNAFGLGARLYSTLHLADHHPVVHNLILSNVPGPPMPLYLAGARLVGLYPLGPITGGAGLNITVLSHEDRIGFGIVTCPDLVARVWDLAGAIPEALRELVSAVTPC